MLMFVQLVGSINCKRKKVIVLHLLIVKEKKVIVLHLLIVKEKKL